MNKGIPAYILLLNQKGRVFHTIVNKHYDHYRTEEVTLPFEGTKITVIPIFIQILLFLAKKICKIISLLFFSGLKFFFWE